MIKNRRDALVVVALILLSAGCSQGNAPSGQAAQQGQEMMPAEKPMVAKEMQGMPGMPMPSGGIMVDPVKQQLIGLRIAEANYQPLEKTIRTVGRVEYDERKLKQINTKIEGWIERLYVDFTGKFVKKGDPLFTIYSPELLSTQEEYLLALQAKQQIGGSPFSRVAAAGNSLLEAAKRRLLLWDR